MVNLRLLISACALVLIGATVNAQHDQPKQAMFKTEAEAKAAAPVQAGDEDTEELKAAVLKEEKEKEEEERTEGETHEDARGKTKEAAVEMKKDKR